MHVNVGLADRASCSVAGPDHVTACAAPQIFGGVFKVEPHVTALLALAGDVTEKEPCRLGKNKNGDPFMIILHGSLSGHYFFYVPPLFSSPP